MDIQVVAGIDSLKSLTFFQENEEIYLDYNQFVTFFQHQKLPHEPALFQSNILKEIKNHGSGVTELNGKRCIKISSFIRYVAKHYDQYRICELIFRDLTNCMFNPQTTDLSILNIYSEVSKFNSLAWCKELLDNVVVEDSSTLHVNYKPRFSTYEWKKICLFEYHFAKDVGIGLSYNEEIIQKQKYLDNLQNVHSIATAGQKKCESVSSVNQLRKDASEKINGINFVCKHVTHSYSSIDQCLNNCIQSFISAKIECVVIKCNNNCNNHHGNVHVFIETSDSGYLNEISEILKCELNNKHGLSCSEIIYLDNGVLSKYVCQNCDPGNIHRFELQQSFLYNKLYNSINKIVTFTEYGDNTADMILEHEGQRKLCSCCFSDVATWVNDKLDWRSLVVDKEWTLNVPLEVQEILMTLFVNKDTFRRSENKVVTLKSKLPKLYCLFDSGLCLYNRNYCGIIQQLNTQELAINYHSLFTVFDITSSSGITRSLKAAERWLKKASDVDKNFFETYIKQYPMKYRSLTETSPTLHDVSLQECYVILFMDNLVRLSVHEDPDPGKSRTSQICTLPITLKGLPKDNSIIEFWHDGDCTESTSTESCACMEPCVLQKSDASLLTENTQEEAASWEKFNTQATWGVILLPDFLSKMLDAEDMLSTKPRKDPNSSLDCLSFNDNTTNITAHPQDNTLLENLEDLERQLDKSLNLNSTVEEEQFLANLQPDDTGAISDIVDTLQKIEQSEKQPQLEEAIEQPDIYLQEFQVPPLLCRHPVPATGRDDDIINLKEILNDTVQKLGRHEHQKDRILFAPDHKISKNLLQLMRENDQFRAFLPEFPVLHLRKSKIVNLFGAYKNAGILHLLKYMKDLEQEDDWMKLITLQNIETASRNVARLSMALHSALLVTFYRQLDVNDQAEFKNNVTTENIVQLQNKWGKHLSSFVRTGVSRNAVFALHIDFMKHCDEVVAISTAEKLGGREGYLLLLAAVKSSLPFAFLNGASAYASFCVELLHIHYGAGIFHQNLKMCLFSTPHKDGTVNVALDTQREMDHKDAVKGFRPRSTIQTVVPRMAVVDHYTDVKKSRSAITSCKNEPEKTNYTDTSVNKSLEPKDNSSVQIPTCSKDAQFVTPVCNMLIRQNVFSIEEQLIPLNVYDSNHRCLPCEMLDQNSYDIGRFLIMKYAGQRGLFNLTEADIQNTSEIQGPSKLIKKARMGKSVTMRRTTTKAVTSTPLENKTESKRKAQVKKQSKILDCMSSSQNTCQSLVNPDGTKATVQKAQGVRKAMLKLMMCAIPNMRVEQIDEYLENKGILVCGEDSITQHVLLRKQIIHATMEFAGVKFKTKATSGEQYLKYIENGIIKSLCYKFPNLRSIIICEEKYSFTPDDFKSATRQKRTKLEPSSIAHLKHGDDVLSDHKLSKSATLQTSEGKRLISNFLARNIHKLDVNKDLNLIVDSELIMKNCDCQTSCDCPPFTHPVEATFNKNGIVKTSVMTTIKQRKGEAELAQVDWLGTLMPKVKSGECIVSVVTSGDIDSIIVHLFAVSLHWHRNDDGTFKTPIYILLQKTKPELYNVTAMIEIIEKHFDFKYAAVNIAMICCMGGNDFLPKVYGIPHEKWISAFMDIPNAVKDILQFSHYSSKPEAGHINRDVYFDVIKHLFCPSTIYPHLVTIEEVRQMSIKLPGREYRHPASWMPPIAALKSLAELIQCQLEYLFTTWDHLSKLPQFLGRGCLTKGENGHIYYDFGPSSRTESKDELLIIDEEILRQRILESKKSSKRRSIEFTPDKNSRRKRRPLTSTPRKIQQIRSAKRLSNVESATAATVTTENEMPMGPICISYVREPVFRYYKVPMCCPGFTADRFGKCTIKNQMFGKQTGRSNEDMMKMAAHMRQAMYMRARKDMSRRRAMFYMGMRDTMNRQRNNVSNRPPFMMPRMGRPPMSPVPQMLRMFNARRPNFNQPRVAFLRFGRPTPPMPHPIQRPPVSGRTIKIIKRKFFPLYPFMSRNMFNPQNRMMQSSGNGPQRPPVPRMILSGRSNSPLMARMREFHPQVPPFVQFAAPRAPQSFQPFGGNPDMPTSPEEQQQEDYHDHHDHQHDHNHDGFTDQSQDSQISANIHVSLPGEPLQMPELVVEQAPSDLNPQSCIATLEAAVKSCLKQSNIDVPDVMSAFEPFNDDKSRVLCEAEDAIFNCISEALKDCDQSTDGAMAHDMLLETAETVQSMCDLRQANVAPSSPGQESSGETMATVENVDDIPTDAQSAADSTNKNEITIIENTETEPSAEAVQEAIQHEVHVQEMRMKEYLLPILVGSGVGFMVLVLLLSLIICCCCKRRFRKKMKMAKELEKPPLKDGIYTIGIPPPQYEVNGIPPMYYEEAKGEKITSRSPAVLDGADKEVATEAGEGTQM